MSETQLKVIDNANLSNSEWQARKNDAIPRAQGNLAPDFR